MMWVGDHMGRGSGLRLGGEIEFLSMRNIA